MLAAAALRSRERQASISDQNSFIIFSHHITICSLMTNKRVIMMCKLKQVVTLSPFKDAICALELATYGRHPYSQQLGAAYQENCF